MARCQLLTCRRAMLFPPSVLLACTLPVLSTWLSAFTFVLLRSTSAAFCCLPAPWGRMEASARTLQTPKRRSVRAVPSPDHHICIHHANHNHLCL